MQKKTSADYLAAYLSGENLLTTSIHGDRTQRQREEALADFTEGRFKILVATAVAARGLDIPQVQHVINYDLPDTADEFIHRIGEVKIIFPLKIITIVLSYFVRPYCSSWKSWPFHIIFLSRD